MTFKKRSCRLNIRVFFKSSTPDPERFHLIKYISVFLKQSLFYYQSQIHDFTCLLNYRLLDKRKNLYYFSLARVIQVKDCLVVPDIF